MSDPAWDLGLLPGAGGFQSECKGRNCQIEEGKGIVGRGRSMWGRAGQCGGNENLWL